MKQLFFFILALYYSFSISAQNEVTHFSQLIKGVVIDADSKKPLVGTTIYLINSSIRATSDKNGNFYIKNVDVGRQIVEASMEGYEVSTINDIMVTSGKEVFITIVMTEKINLLIDVIVNAKRNKIKPNNEFATLSARSFSIEDTKRYPAATFDPGRMAQNFAGVSSNADGGNEIVVRGNSPKGVLWHLEGVEIPSPNHFGGLGTSGGAISMLSSSTLGNSDFYTGAFPAEFGNATSGVFDLNFRNGNKDKREYSIMIGLMGIEAATEGPFKKGGQSSYLFNYRYSTISLVNGFLDLGGVSPNYQDFSFKFNFPTKKAGTFALFGLGGTNKAIKNPVADSSKWTDENPNFVLEAPSKLGVMGLTHQIFINQKSYIKTTISVSGQSSVALLDTLNPSDHYNKIPVGSEKNLDSSYRISVVYNNKLNGKSSIRLGIINSKLLFNYNNNYFDNIENRWKQILAAKGSSMYYQAFVQWKYRISNSFTINTGIHSSFMEFNKSKSIEPRIAFSYKALRNQAYSFAAGLHAKPEHLSTYYYENIDQNSIRNSPNKNLSMNKAIHLVLGYDKFWINRIRMKFEAYYQFLYDIPVEKKSGSYFSMLNSSSFYDLKDMGTLVSTGKGKNYGIDLTFERPFSNNYYFLVTGSLFESKYTNYDNKQYNTRYNRNYQLNLVTGKEWKRRKTSNKSWGLNGKILTSGGLRESEIDLAASMLNGKVIYIPDHYYTQRGNPYFRLDIGINFRNNRKHSTHTLMIDFQNLTSNKNLYNSYYDNKTGTIKKTFQTGFFPFLNYRIEF